MSTRRAVFRRLAVVFAIVTILFLCFALYVYFFWSTTFVDAPPIDELPMGFNPYFAISLGISAASLVVTIIFGIVSQPARTRGLLMMLGSALVLMAGAALPWTHVTSPGTFSVPADSVSFSLLQLALANGYQTSFAIIFETATALLLIGILTYSRRLRALTGFVGLLGRAVNLGTIAFFVGATLTVFAPGGLGGALYNFPPGAISTCDMLCSGGGDMMRFAPSLGFFLVVVGLLVATIGSWALNRPEDDSAGISAATAATVTTPSAKPQ
jgi:hypothetical protein